jgi:hypothetical protein
LKKVKNLTNTISSVIEKQKKLKAELKKKKKKTMGSITSNLNDSEVVNEAAKQAIFESIKFA